MDFVEYIDITIKLAILGICLGLARKSARLPCFPLILLLLVFASAGCESIKSIKCGPSGCIFDITFTDDQPKTFTEISP